MPNKVRQDPNSYPEEQPLALVDPFLLAAAEDRGIRLADIPLERLALSPAMESALWVEGIRSLGDLAGHRGEFTKTSYFQRWPDALRELRAKVDRSLSSLLDSTGQDFKLAAPLPDVSQQQGHRILEPTSENVPPHVSKKTSIAVLQLSADVRARLKLVGVTTIEQLAQMSPQHILDVPYIGEKSLSEIESALADYLAEHFPSGSPFRPEEPSFANAPLGTLGLSVRSHNTLMRAGIRTVGRLVGMSDEDILNVDDIGIRSLAEIRRKLSDYLGKASTSQMLLSEGAPLARSSSGKTEAASAADAPIDDLQLPQEEPPPVEESKRDSPSSMRQPDDIPLDVLGLSCRAYNCLRRAGLCTVAEVAALTDEQLLDIHNLGVTTLAEIRERLTVYSDIHQLPEQHPASGASRATQVRLSGSTRIDVLRLSLESYNALWRNGILTIGQLARMSSEQILGIQNVNEKSLAEIERKLKAYLDEYPLLAPELIAPTELELLPPAHSVASSPVGQVPVPENTPIDVLGLSVRPYGALWRGGIVTIGQLAQMSPEQILSVQGVGEKSLAEIREKLAAYLAHPPLPEQHQPSEPSHATQVYLSENTPVAVLRLSIDSYNALWRNGILTIGQLARMSSEQIRGIQNIDEKSLAEIEGKLRAYLDEHPLPPPARSAASPPASQVPGPENPSIEVLGLSIRLHNALMREGIITIGQLAQMSQEQILYIRNVGEKSLAEIGEKLEAYLAEHPWVPPEPIEPAEPEPPLPLVDPTLLARVAQVPLDNISVERLALPVRWRDLLLHRGIRSVGELARQPASAFGQDSLVGKQLARYLTWLVEQDEATWADEVAGRGISPLHRLALSETTLEVLVGQWLDAIGPQESWVPELTRRSQYRQVICWRYGLDGESLTLEEIGKHIGVSRERVRQIQGRALRILSKPQHREVIPPLRALLVHLLEQAGGLMSEAQVEVVLRHEVIVGDVEPVGVARLVFETEDNVKWLRETRAWGLTHYPLAEVDDVQHRLAQVLGKEQVPLPCEEVVSRFKRSRFYCNRQGKLGSGFIAACLRAHPRILINDEKLCSLERWERHRIDKIILALRKIGEPAHYQDIAQVTNELSPPELRTSPRVIHAQLGQHPDLFVWVGQRGTYGLKEWGLEKPPTYEEALVQVFKASERPLTIHKILALLPEVRQVCNENSVSMTLMMNERFRTFPDGTYGLSSWSLADDVEERTLPPDFLEDVKQRLFQELSEQAQAQSSIREVSRIMEG